VEEKRIPKKYFGNYLYLGEGGKISLEEGRRLFLLREKNSYYLEKREDHPLLFLRRRDLLGEEKSPSPYEREEENHLCFTASLPREKGGGGGLPEGGWCGWGRDPILNCGKGLRPNSLGWGGSGGRCVSRERGRWGSLVGGLKFVLKGEVGGGARNYRETFSGKVSISFWEGLSERSSKEGGPSGQRALFFSLQD